jgi:hypothetical protein
MQSPLRRLRKLKQWITRACTHAQVSFGNLYWRKVRKRKIVFVTFADGKKFTSDRIADETRKLEFFDSIVEHSADTLGPNFTCRFSEHLKIERGYGLWAWKPYVILQTLDLLEQGDVVFYADSGCSVAGVAAETLKVVLNTLRQAPDRIMVADDEFGYSIRTWTKAEVIDHLKIAVHDSALDGRMWSANRIALQNTPQNRMLIERWCDLASILRLIDDSASNCKEHPGFREHRHDQSILNLLMIGTAPLTGLERAFFATRLKS